VSNGRCVATIVAVDKWLFEFNALRGAVGFDLFVPEGKRIPQAATAQLKADDHVFAFVPAFIDDGVGMYLDGILEPQDLKAVRAARKLILIMGSERLLEIPVDGTDLESSIDAVVDCSNGRSGWWGDGVKP
jgi:hypothetical protein